MKLLRLIYKLVNGILTAVMICTMVLLGGYAALVLWENSRRLEDTREMWVQMQQWKPEPQQEQGPSFEELKAINPDVCGWVTMDGTKIDFPILQGESNLTYLNRNVYGEFSLAGSIFLDCRNSGDFAQPYNLLYGHHMARGNMFGDLDLYKNREFFEENTAGQLIVPEGVHDLAVYACLLVNSDDGVIFEPEFWQRDPQGAMDYVQSKALYLRQEQLTPDMKTLALTTCGSESADTRTVVLAKIEP